MSTIKKMFLTGLAAIAATTASAQSPAQRVYTGRVLHVEESLWQGSNGNGYLAMRGSYVVQLEKDACAQRLRTAISSYIAQQEMSAAVLAHQQEAGVLKHAEGKELLVTLEGRMLGGDRCMTVEKAYFGAPKKTLAEDPTQPGMQRK